MTTPAAPADLVLFAHLPMPGLVLELDGTIVAANAALCRLVGRTEAELVGRPLDVLVANNTAPLLALGQRPRAIELELSGATAGVVLEVVTAVLPAGDREYIQLFGVDVSARKLRTAVEEQHSAKQRAESLGIVAGGIAHDFNNLLVGVLAEASSAREDTALPIQTIEAFRRIETGARKMAQLTRSMLAYAGRGRVDNQRIDPDGLVRDMNDQLSRMSRGAALKIRQHSEPIAIEADASLLRQLIANLVANAFDARSTAVEVASRIVMRGNGANWEIEVSDDGEGIPATNLGRIFEPFFTTRKDQTGLGLSAAQGIVRRLGGEIEVDSSPGAGARFRVRLPVLAGVEAPLSRPTLRGVTPVARLAGLEVLIADDEPTVRSTVRRLLERRGARIHLAADGVEGEAKLSSELGLIILDVSMPGRTGYDVLATARRVCPEVPVILMSGYTEQAIGPGGERPDGFLEKPFTARALDGLIDHVMRESAARKQR